VQKPFGLSHPFKDQPPKINETVIITFLEEQHRREIVAVWADATPDKEKVKITVFFEDEAFEKTGQPAVSRWNKMKSAWIRKGWLIDPLAQLHLKKTRGILDKTKDNIKKLRNYRWEYIKDNGKVPTKADAMSKAGISYHTCKTHDPQLLKKWKDMDYE
jgi:hypothetical protein